MINGTLNRVKIIGLHGNKTIDVQIKENNLVLVGENGSGKTTFLRILFHVLSGQLRPLNQERFESITISIGEHEYVIQHEDLTEAIGGGKVLSKLSMPVRNRIKYFFKRRDLDEVEKIANRFHIPLEIIFNELNRFEMESQDTEKPILKIFENIQQVLDSQILYLPTYRRIERELGSIYKNLNTEEFQRARLRKKVFDADKVYIELVEFGMKDVEISIKNDLEGIKDFARKNLSNLTLKYLGDVVDRVYQNVGISEIADVPKETIRKVLEQIPEDILTKDHKEHLLDAINTARTNDNPDEHSKIICHYFSKLWSFQESLKESEKKISAFCLLCNEYMVDKTFNYDRTTFEFSIFSTPSNDGSQSKIELKDLSSGEKQIVSLFSHLYLSGNKKYFVLIDEPELSLSVPWQRRFLLDIRNGEFCSGLVAATHSPFIYENELKKYAHSMGEFILSEKD